jgi:hypothetical protein
MRPSKAEYLFVCMAILAVAELSAAVAGLSAEDANRITVTGEVVDAACYMIHPQSATGPSHRQCALACADRGVPLAILNESDKKLYFPAGGNKQLYEFTGHRVRATGTSVDKSEPMELSMPVGEKNKLSVRVEGGYKVLTIARISQVAGSH